MMKPKKPAATPRRRRLPALPAPVTTALLATTALTAAFVPKLPPFQGD